MSLDLHRGLEAALGFALIALAVIANFPIAGFLLAMGAGALTVTVAFAATREGRTLTGSAHRAADIMLATVDLVAALTAAFLLDPAGPRVVLGLALFAEVGLILTTRYVERAPRKAPTSVSGPAAS
jgi:hypothetical protein